MNCTVCGGDAYHLVKTRNDYTVLRCRSCALVFCAPMPTPAELDAFYQGFAYSKPEEADLQRQIRYTRAGTAQISREVNGIVKRPIRRVLDFGGGLGFFADALARSYPEVTLFDLDSHARDFARERFPEAFRVVDTAKEALGATYDLILLNQVIEHVPDPVTFLRPFCDALEPGGVMVVTTPNNRSNDMVARPDVLVHYARAVRRPVASATSLMLRDSWLCCDPPRHLYAFNGDNLKLIAKRAGFRSVRTATAYFDEDPLGQPKYRYAGFGSAKAAALTLLFYGTKISTPLLRLFDRSEQRGTTLIGYLSR